MVCVDYEYSENAIKTLFDPILRILEAHPGGITEYELMKKLSESNLPFPGEKTRPSDLELFRSHFLLFHVLYRLRDHLLSERRYLLSIFCLEIKLYPYEETGDQRVEATAPAEAEPMRDYYLDLENMEKVGEEDVKRMLKDFFRRLEAHYRREEDLAVLGLPPGTELKTVKKRYRSLAFEHHPDRGGDEKEFRRIGEAMERLEQLEGQSP